MDGVFYQVGGLLYVQFLHNIGTVMFYGADTNIQETGNLFVGDSLGNELQDFSFPYGQGIILWRQFAVAGRLDQLMCQLPG